MRIFPTKEHALAEVSEGKVGIGYANMHNVHIIADGQTRFLYEVNKCPRPVMMTLEDLDALTSDFSEEGLKVYRRLKAALS